MPQALSLALRETIDRELPILREFPVAQSAQKPAGADSWSPKQELGHLIDSAANNHVRFVRAALEPEFQGPGYAQNAWVDIHAYHEMPWKEIVDFWYQYNRFLSGLVLQVPPNKLATSCSIGKDSPVTLGFLIEDYILHMQHHIDHLLGRPVVTEYPSAKVPLNQKNPTVL